MFQLRLNPEGLVLAMRDNFPPTAPPNPYNQSDVGHLFQHDVDVDAGQFEDAVGELSLADLSRGIWPINSEYDLRCMLAAEIERIVRVLLDNWSNFIFWSASNNLSFSLFISANTP